MIYFTLWGLNAELKAARLARTDHIQIQLALRCEVRGIEAFAPIKWQEGVSRSLPHPNPEAFEAPSRYSEAIPWHFLQEICLR